MSERIRGGYDDALYKSTYTLLFFTTVWCVRRCLLKVQHDIDDYGNALNRLRQQLDKISDAANEELVSGCDSLLYRSKTFYSWNAVYRSINQSIFVYCKDMTKRRPTTGEEIKK